MALTENEYNQLYKYSLKAAYKYMGYSDRAYDVAQNSILAFISTKTSVKSPYSWLRTTVKREAMKFAKSEKRQAITAIKAAVNKTEDMAETDEEDDVVLKLNIQKIKQILSAQDFQSYQNLKKHNFSLKMFSEHQNISIGTAKTIKRRILRNIMSAILLKEGWSSSKKILNYNQYLCINKFINHLIDSVKKQELSQIRNYLQKVNNIQLNDIFSGAEACHEWSVAYSDNNYKLVIVCAPFNPYPKVVELTVRFNNQNFLQLVGAIEKQPVFIAKNTTDELVKYKEKGEIKLTTDQIVSILSNKKTDT